MSALLSWFQSEDFRVELDVSGKAFVSRFVAVSWTASDGHHFICATEHLLLLSDIQISSGQLSQWHHGVPEPRYLASYRLSNMRSNSSNVEHEWASEEGFCILVGSFWNDECSLFCYGPHPPDVESPSSAESKSDSSFYAWELPSHISLSGHECCCSTCLLRLEFAKDTLLEWIEWQQKRDLDYVSGNLEAQRYRGSWDMPRADGALHEHEEGDSCTLHREYSQASIHAEGFAVSTSAVSVADSFRGLGIPMSMYKVASRRAWATLPMDVLKLAFSNYAEILSVLANYHQKTSLDFLAVPDQGGLPPFLLRNPPQRSNKWTSKVKRGDYYVGPVLPLPVCLALDAAKEIAIVDSGCDLIKKSSMSLVDDKEETWGSSQDSRAFVYEPTASFDELSIENGMEICPFDVDRRSKLTIKELPNERLKCGGNVSGMELFDDLCPVKLSFNTREGDFDDDELKWYHLLKRQFSKWEVGYTPYKDFCSQLNQKGGPYHKIMEQWFNAGGSEPLCIDQVLLEMCKARDIVPESNLGHPTSGTLSQLFRKVLRFTAGFGSASAEDVLNDHLILLVVLKDKAADVVKKLYQKAIGCFHTS
ncbi:hypothetical protein AKJ16_DCAP17513 [Drosera capensis]